jgi:hypothetical protein
MICKKHDVSDKKKTSQFHRYFLDHMYDIKASNFLPAPENIILVMNSKIIYVNVVDPKADTITILKDSLILNGSKFFYKNYYDSIYFENKELRYVWYLHKSD